MRKVESSGSMLFRTINVQGIEIDYLARSFFKLGRMRMEKGEVDAALADLALAVEVDPKLADAFALRGLIFLGRRQYTESIREFTEAIKIVHKPSYYLNRGSAKFMLTGESSARSDFDNFLKFNPIGKPILDRQIAVLRAELQRRSQSQP